MPPKRKTRVASQTTRVATGSDDVTKSTSPDPVQTDSSMSKRKTRGRPGQFKKTGVIEEIESSGQRPRKTAKKGRKVAPKKSKAEILNELDDGEEIEEPSAMDALKSKIKGAGQRNSDVTDQSAGTARRESTRRRTSSVSAPPQRRVASTPQPGRYTSCARQGGSVAPSDDLYGLSPAGKASQARVDARRTSIQAPVSALKIRRTPGMDNSMLALANFKRRPRQPSLIRMVQRTSELGAADEDMYRDIDAELDETLRTFEDFEPEDESTPLQLGKKKSDVDADAEEQEEARTSSSHKRKAAELEDDVQIPRSPSVASSPPHIAGTTWARSSSLPMDPVIPSTGDQDPINADPVSQSDLTAPPSSSAPSSPKRQRRPNDDGARPKAALKISTAHLQALLPRPRAKSRLRAGTPQGTYEIPSDSASDSSEQPVDELSSRPARPRARSSKTRPNKSTTTATAKATAKTKTTPKTQNPLAKRDANQRAPSRSSKNAASMKHTRTYARGDQEPGKENSPTPSSLASSLSSPPASDDEADETTAHETRRRRHRHRGPADTGHAQELSGEMERMRDKFARVDAWEMDFESVDLLGGESSPWR